VSSVYINGKQNLNLCRII